MKGRGVFSLIPRLCLAEVSFVIEVVCMYCLECFDHLKLLFYLICNQTIKCPECWT